MCRNPATVQHLEAHFSIQRPKPILASLLRQRLCTKGTPAACAYFQDSDSCNLLRPLIKILLLLVPYGYIIIINKKEFLRRRQIVCCIHEIALAGDREAAAGPEKMFAELALSYLFNTFQYHVTLCLTRCCRILVYHPLFCYVLAPNPTPRRGRGIQILGCPAAPSSERRTS